MKKSILAIMLLVSLLLCSCGNTGNVQTTASTTQTYPDPADIDYSTDLHFENFSEMCADESLKEFSEGQKISLFNYIDGDMITPRGFKSAGSLNFTIFNDLVNGEDLVATGEHYIELYFHEESCNCYTVLCQPTGLRYNIWYEPDGLETDLKDDEKISENHYAYKVAMGYITHIFMVNERCRIMFSLPEALENYDAVLEDVEAYADYLRVSIAEDEK